MSFANFSLWVKILIIAHFPSKLSRMCGSAPDQLRPRPSRTNPPPLHTYNGGHHTMVGTIFTQSGNHRKSRPFCIDPPRGNGLAPILILSTQSDRPRRPFQGWTTEKISFPSQIQSCVIHSFYKPSARMTTFAQPPGLRLFDQMSLSLDSSESFSIFHKRGIY